MGSSTQRGQTLLCSFMNYLHQIFENDAEKEKNEAD